jgi:nucleoside-diphosphate-sugar epimerase|uniref:SDR family oxidoreductase n=1 Tax=Cephaloticoccus sp. TaxID=1985742 RepID=UPI004049380E
MSLDSHRFFTKKQLVVLGCGYIGAEVARQAVIRGLKVTALTRNPAKAAKLRTDGIDVIESDLASHGWHKLMPPRADFVLNCVSSGGNGIEGYRQSYVGGMESALAWSRSAEIGAFVYTGSTSVYPQDGGVSVDETSATDPINDRAALLLETEDIVRASTTLGRWFILRLAGIYGPGRHHILDQLQSGKTLSGSGTHRLNLVHRDDICSAIWSALGAPDKLANGVFNVADDAPVSKAELASWLADQMGLPAPTFDPTVQSTRGRIVPDRLILNTKLKQQLGWRPVFSDFRQGYANILASL